MKKHRSHIAAMCFRHSTDDLYSPCKDSGEIMKFCPNAAYLFVGAPDTAPAPGPVELAPPIRFENSVATSGGIPPGPLLTFWFACVPFVAMTKIPAIRAMAAMTTRISVTGEMDCFMMLLSADASLHPAPTFGKSYEASLKVVNPNRY
jgi:hypothetical protein